MIGRSQNIIRGAVPLAVGLAMGQALHNEQEAWKAGMGVIRFGGQLI
jgi:hypothetical protein